MPGGRDTEQPGGFHRIGQDDSPAILLARIDERTRNTQDDVAEIKGQLQHKYVTQEAFNNLREQVTLLRNIIFGLIGLICVGVVGAVLKLVILQPPNVPGAS
jgi:hypothetical protein